MMELFRDSFRVPIEEMMHRAGLLKKLNKALVLMEGREPGMTQKDIAPVLAHLETLHKVIALYLWFTYRQPVAFPDQEKAFQLRQLTELAMDWCLEVLHQLRLKAKDPAAKARKAVLNRRPLTKQELPAVESEPAHSPRKLQEDILTSKSGTLFCTIAVLSRVNKWLVTPSDAFIRHIVR